MRRKTKLIAGITTLLLLIAGGVATWYFFFNEQRVLNVVYADIMSPLDPYSLDARNAAVIHNTYEGVVETDQFFRPKRGIVLSWSRSTPTTWDLVVRKGVDFHDGTELTAEHIAESYNLSMEKGGTELKFLLQGITSFEATEDYRLTVSTNVPDPLLLAKLSFMPVLLEKEGATYGTGPFTIAETTDAKITFSRNGNYWGDAGPFAEVILQEMESKSERIQKVFEGEIDVLGSVPTGNQFISAIESDLRYELHTLPSLELFSLYFNTSPEVGEKENPLNSKETRAAISKAIDRFEIASFAESGFARPVYQFVPEGVLGFLPDVEATIPNTDDAKAIFDERPATFTLAVTEPMKIIGEFIRFQMKGYGAFVDIQVLSEEEFAQRLEQGDLHMFVLGWRYELGDSTSFLQTHIHSKEEGYGQYNATGVSIESIDDAIEAVQSEFDETERLTQLQQIQRTLLEEYVGVPLVETTSVYASNVFREFRPRLDGQVLFHTLK